MSENDMQVALASTAYIPRLVRASDIATAAFCYIRRVFCSDAATNKSKDAAAAGGVRRYRHFFYLIRFFGHISNIEV
jgi:hypothetical protein